MKKIIKLEKEWADANSLKAQLAWQHQLFLRDASLGRNCENELAAAAAGLEASSQKLRMERARYALQCVGADKEEMEFFQAEYDEVVDAYIESDDYKALLESLSPAAREALVDWVNIHGYPQRKLI